ncbi:UV-stimulated scaffold protein A homolog [Impatiens glandulifera]|uniref:UV-stimulated scaffold protein A homolog n=1 Tax=Impatiens glandulifera TaxID=253017 RepID=UPI001FB10E7C|nr:UV-stimulated scaffold protein A homolog [Impatiens glandulifera]
MEETENRKTMVIGLIEKATNSTAHEVDPRLLKAIKRIVRFSNFELQLSAQTLMTLMKRDHSQVRFLSLLIIDELFMRSKLFRSVIVENFDNLLTLSIGFRRNSPLPAPASIASLLRARAIEFLEKWNVSYGVYYRQIRLGFHYLKNTLRFQFPNIQANAARIDRVRREREAGTKELLLNKFENLKSNIHSIREQIQSTVDEIKECLEIITSRGEIMPIGPLDDEEEVEEFQSSELRKIRLDSLKEGEKVHEDGDNKVVFDAVRELYKVLVTKHMVTLQEFISVLIRVEVTDNRFRDRTLKEFIDIINHLKLLKKKCEGSGCGFRKSASDNEDNIWEEGTDTIKKPPPSSTNSSISYKQTPGASTSSIETNNKASDSKIEFKDIDHERNKLLDTKIEFKDIDPEKNKLMDTKIEFKDIDPEKNKLLDTKIEFKDIDPEKNKLLDTKIEFKDIDPERNKLLEEAPVIEWGSHLDNWGSREFLANQRGMEFESHWGRVDYDAVIPSEKIEELNIGATLYNEESVEIHPCSAPLRKGGLCQRRDLKICPFHGPIVARDDEGNPIIQICSPESDLLEQLAKQAVKNVHGRDEDEAKNREFHKKAMKRARIAEVREHNASVLRDAAIASTSRSSGFEDELRLTNRRSKEQSLASMLKKKVTSRDRLSQRLLNRRGRDAA